MRQRGFTLVEMLVVISLIGTVVGGIAHFMHRSYAHTRRAESRLAADRDSRVVMAMLRDDIRSHVVVQAGDSLVLGEGLARIVYRIDHDGLVREADGKTQVLLWGARSLEFEKDGSAVSVRVSVRQVIGDLVLNRSYRRTLATQVTP